VLRLAHTSDLHIDERGRLDDVQHVLRAFIEGGRRAAVDLFVVAGDFFERRSTPTERNALADFLKAATEVAPVVGSKGNHDVAGDLELFNRLKTKHPIHIEERATAQPGSAYMVDLAGGRRVGVLGMAWIDKANFVSGLDASVDQEQTRYMTIESMRDLLTCLRAEARRVRSVGAAPILVTHVMLGGSVVSTGQVLIGIGLELSPSDLKDIDASYVACGHIHASQEWFGGRVAYSGSPARHTYGESEAKGWRLVTLEDDGRFVSNEFMELPARRIVLLEEDWTNPIARAVGLCVDPIEVAGALVRVRYHIRPQDLHLVNEEVLSRAILADGAHEVQLECVIEAETRVRAGEIVLARSTAEKVDAYLSAKQIEIDAATRVRVHAKLAEIEGGTHAAL